MNGLTRLARFSLYFFGLGYIGFGALLLVSPASITTLAEIALPTPVAAMEIRGVYGGQFLGTGLMMILFARRESWFRPGMAALAAIMGGLVAGRTLGVIMEGTPNLLIAALFVSEVLGLIVAVLALRRP